MLICLEGVDGAGKSTLAEQLAAATSDANSPVTNPRAGLFQFHFSQPKAHPLEEYEANLDFYRPGVGVDVICDRFHWGEMIYSELYRDGSQLGAAGFWHVEQYLRSRGGLMLHVTAPLSVIESRLLTRGEDYLESHHVAHVHAEFQRLCQMSSGWPFTVDSPANQATVEAIIAIARLREQEAALLARFPGYLGPLNPKTLLVGERPNVNANRANHVVPFLPYPATSALYLIENVILPSPDPAGVGLVNAYNAHGQPTALRDLYHRLDEPRVVALGTVADRQLTALDVPRRTAPHPQYWRRFRYHNPDGYRELVFG